MNRTMDAERAWEIPGKIYDRLGTLDLKSLGQLDEEGAVRLFREPSALHRFPETMAKCFRSAVAKILRDYDGDASRIWAGNPGSGELVRRFKRFDGVGQKISTMAANILIRDFRIDVADRQEIDISVDLHVKRVFERLELVAEGASRDEIVRTARMINPEYPGILDFAIWQIGREWCTAGTPACAECFLNNVCPSSRVTSEVQQQHAGPSVSRHHGLSSTTSVQLSLPRNHVGQLLDGIEVLIEQWDATATYLQTGTIGNDCIRECSDVEEAEWIADFYRKIAAEIQDQM